MCPSTKFLTCTSIFIIDLNSLVSEILSIQITTEITFANMFPLYQRVTKTARHWPRGGSTCLKCSLQVLPPDVWMEKFQGDPRISISGR